MNNKNYYGLCSPGRMIIFGHVAPYAIVMGDSFDFVWFKYVFYSNRTINNCSK